MKNQKQTQTQQDGHVAQCIVMMHYWLTEVITCTYVYCITMFDYSVWIPMWQVGIKVNANL